MLWFVENLSLKYDVIPSNFNETTTCCDFEFCQTFYFTVRFLVIYLYRKNEKKTLIRSLCCIGWQLNIKLGKTEIQIDSNWSTLASSTLWWGYMKVKFDWKFDSFLHGELPKNIVTKLVSNNIKNEITSPNKLFTSLMVKSIHNSKDSPREVYEIQIEFRRFDCLAGYLVLTLCNMKLLSNFYVMCE